MVCCRHIPILSEVHNMMEPHAKRLCVGDAVLILHISFMTGQSVRVRVQDNLFVSELQSAIGAAVGRACSNGKVFMNGRSEYLPSGGKLVELGVKDGDQLYMLEKPGELHMQVLCPQLAHSLWLLQQMDSHTAASE